MLVREELLTQNRIATERYDSTQPPYEAYKVDYELFRLIFVGLSPWGKASESLSARLFRVCRFILLRSYFFSTTFFNFTRFMLSVDKYFQNYCLPNFISY